jgi:hypothetical protein
MTDPSDRLAESADHLLTAEKLIDQQTALVNRLLNSHRDVRQAWHLLALFEDIQIEMLKHHRWISDEVDFFGEWKRRSAVRDAK